MWSLKPERWGSPLVQEKYQEEKACGKRHNDDDDDYDNYNDNNNNDDDDDDDNKNNDDDDDDDDNNNNMKSTQKRQKFRTYYTWMIWGWLLNHRKNFKNGYKQLNPSVMILIWNLYLKNVPRLRLRDAN